MRPECASKFSTEFQYAAAKSPSPLASSLSTRLAKARSTGSHGKVLSVNGSVQFVICYLIVAMSDELAKLGSLPLPWCCRPM